MAYQNRRDIRGDDADHILPPYSPPGTAPGRATSPAPSYRTQAPTRDSPRGTLSSPLASQRPSNATHRRASSSRSLFTSIFGKKAAPASTNREIEQACIRGLPEDWAVVLSILQSDPAVTISKIVLNQALISAVTRHDYHESSEELAGREEVVRALLRTGACPNETSAIMLAIKHLRNEQVLDDLLAGGARVGDLDRTPVENPLHSALVMPRQNVRYVERLVRAGADALRTFGRSTTMLHIVAEKWRGEDGGYLIELLTSVGAKVDAEDGSGRRPLELSVIHYNDHVTQALLDCDAQVTHSILVKAADLDERIMWTLLDQRPGSVNIKDAGGTPLLFSLLDSKTPALTIDRLVQAGCDVRARGPDRSNVLHVLVRLQKWILADIFLDQGAHVLPLDAVDDAGNAPLDLVLRLEEPRSPAWWQRFVITLIRAGSDVRRRNALGQTPLHLAAQNTRGASVIPALIDAGADVEGRDYSNKSALDDASCCVTRTMLIDAAATPSSPRKVRGTGPSCRVYLPAQDLRGQSCSTHVHCRDCKIRDKVEERRSDRDDLRNFDAKLPSSLLDHVYRQ